MFLLKDHKPKGKDVLMAIVIVVVLCVLRHLLSTGIYQAFYAGSENTSMALAKITQISLDLALILYGFIFFRADKKPFLHKKNSIPVLLAFVLGALFWILYLLRIQAATAQSSSILLKVIMAINHEKDVLMAFGTVTFFAFLFDNIKGTKAKLVLKYVILLYILIVVGYLYHRYQGPVAGSGEVLDYSLRAKLIMVAGFILGLLLQIHSRGGRITFSFHLMPIVAAVLLVLLGLLPLWAINHAPWLLEKKYVVGAALYGYYLGPIMVSLLAGRYFASGVLSGKNK